MDKARLRAILDRFPSLRVLVVGDYFLDKYLIMERALSEFSLETNLEARQVVAVRTSPGAAGTVVNNLRALGVGVLALGVIGDTGEGYELLRGLDSVGADRSLMVVQPDLLTPTYTKPVMCEVDGYLHELERMDIKNRAPLDGAVEALVIERLRAALPGVDGVIVSEFNDAASGGIISRRVRAELIALAEQRPDKVFTVDSRPHLAEYRSMVLNPNLREARAALGAGEEADAERVGRALAARTGRPVLVTLGERGMLACEVEGCTPVPAVVPEGPVDIVGAGDSALAGLTAALCAGASPVEAALVGNLVASITVQQIGTTGTATPAQVLAQFGKLSARSG